jgi:hypothetical protein
LYRNAFLPEWQFVEMAGLLLNGPNCQILHPAIKFNWSPLIIINGSLILNPQRIGHLFVIINGFYSLTRLFA